MPLVHEDFARREATLDRVREALLRSGASDLLTTSSNRLIVLLQHVAPGSWTRYDDLVLPRAVQGDRETQHALVEGFEAPLRAGRGGALWTETLFALARHEFVPNATAETLGIHISTLRHRLERIEDRLGLDLHDPEVRLRLRVAGYVRGLARDLPA